MRMMVVACIAFAAGALFASWLDYSEIRNGLSDTEWEWLKSFYEQLKAGKIKVVDAPEEEEEADEDDRRG